MLCNLVTYRQPLFLVFIRLNLLFYHRCSLMKQISTTISEQDATTDNLLTNTTRSYSNNFMICMLYTETVIDLCISCVLTTFNDDDDDDDVTCC